jgi:hypothetical protein
MQQREENAQHWQTVEERLMHVVDALGVPIDAKIFEVVVALNVAGFTTIGSCEGHLDGKRSCFPWVDIAIGMPEEAQTQALLALQDAERQAARLPQHEGDTLIAQATQCIEQLDRTYHLPIRQRLISYLTQFYASHRTSYDHQLILVTHSPFGFAEELRLQPVNAESLQTCTLEELVSLQQEMQAFAAFLKYYAL